MFPLVTLTGGPGIGKSRLAVEVGANEGGAYRDGVWLVELADVKGVRESSVAGAIGRTLAPVSSALRGAKPGVGALVRGLADKELLLILDNCEHLVEICAEVVHALLLGCPRLRTLATSQEALRVRGEAVFRVPPLRLASDPRSGSPNGPTEAVQLFLERLAARPAITSRLEKTRILEICRRLEGNPLAIELAAGRLSSVSHEELVERLDRPFNLLKKGDRSSAPRHRSLEAACEWSYRLLDPDQQLFLRRLSVFAGSFETQAVRAVCRGGSISESEVPDLLDALVGKSLLLAEATSSGTRYRLPSIIRHYADHLWRNPAEKSRVRSNHAAWYAQLAETAERGIEGATQAEHIRAVEAEMGNFQAAVSHLSESGRINSGLQLVTALIPFWRLSGEFREGLTLLNGFTHSVGLVPIQLRAKLLCGQGLFSALVGELEDGISKTEEGLALAREAADSKLVGRTLNLLGFLSMYGRGPMTALGFLEESVAMSRRAEDFWCLADSLGRCGQVAMLQSHFETARSRFQECLTVSRESKDQRTEVLGLDGVVWLGIALGDLAEAEKAVKRALQMSEGLGDKLQTAEILVHRGILQAAKGSHPSAKRSLRKALAIGNDIGSPIPIATALGALGGLERAGQDPVHAGAVFEAAIPVARKAGLRYVLIRALGGKGVACTDLRQFPEARHCYDQALSIAKEVDDKQAIAHILYALSRLSRLKSDNPEAITFLHEALAVLRQIGDLLTVAACFEGLAGLLTEEGRPQLAARLFGAASLIRDEVHAPMRSPQGRALYESDLRATKRALGAKDFKSAWAQGRAMSPEEAVAYATKGRGIRRRPLFGWKSLTNAEKDVVRLVAEGLSNGQIAERLFISRRTVESHLTHIFDKLTISTRTELASKASTRGL